MKKLIFMFAALALVMFVGIPVMADDASDLNYIQSIRSGYMDRINIEGQTMIFDQIRIVEKGTAFNFPLTVGRGNYEIWAIGGFGVRDLNLSIYSPDGSVLSESTNTGNFPVLSFYESESLNHRVEIKSSNFDPGVSQGYFLVIVLKTD